MAEEYDRTSKLRIDREELNQSKFKKTPDDKIAIRVNDEQSEVVLDDILVALEDIAIVREVTPVIAAGVYTEGDAFGGVQTITTPIRSNGGSSVLQGIVCRSKKKLKSQFDYVFFRESPDATDHDIFDPSDAEVLDDCLGAVTLFAGQYVAFSTSSVGTVSNIGKIMDSIPGGTTIYCVQIIRSAHIYAIGDVVNQFDWLQG